MKNFLKRLDGTSQSRGQSLVELALVMPFLIILLAVLMEFGYFASHYITLTEVSRSVARAATTLQHNVSPLYWEDFDNGLLDGSKVVPDNPALRQVWLSKYRNCRVDDPSAKFGFYNLLGCMTLQSMNPMRISGFEPGASTTDDIIISGFTVAPDGKDMLLVKRYPSNAIGCYPNNITETFGFAWGGNYVNSQGCLGSEFTNDEVAELMNLRQFGLGYELTDQRRYLQPQGLVLVELHWQHETLSQFVGFSPVFSPLFDILGYSMDIYTWAVFPLPQVERET